MSKVINKSIENFLKFSLKKAELRDKDYEKINKIVDKSQNDCCDSIIVYWIDGVGSSNTNPTKYQLQFKDINNNIIRETEVDGINPQIIKIPKESYQVCLNVLIQASGGIGGGFSITGSEGYYFADIDSEAVYCDSLGLTPVNDIYILRSIDGSPE